jgi:hypothetical protein
MAFGLGRTDMTKITKATDKRGSDRRGADRRKDELPIIGADRRVADRRSGQDRRAR